MNTKFVEGDLLLYFNEEVVYVVVLDLIDRDYFIVVVSEENEYFYGRQIKIKHLTEKYFMKIDHFGKIDSPCPWIQYLTCR